MKIAVSELVVRFMKRLGIDHIFGMPGAHILPVYNCLYHSSIQTVLAKHEQGALFKSIKHYTVHTESDLKDLLPKLDHKDSINLIEIMIDKDIFPNYVSRR